MRSSLLAILTLGMFTITPSSTNAMDLKKDLGKDPGCVKSFAESYENGSNTKWCITNKNKVYINVNGRNNLHMGHIGSAANMHGSIRQYEIENGKLVSYKCPAPNNYSLECAGEIKKSVIE